MSQRPFLPISSLAVLLLAGGCALGPAERPGDFAELAAAAPPAPEADEKSKRAGAQLHILAGEMAAGRNQPEMAAREFLKALEYVPDAELAERATMLAASARNEELALAAARRWLELEPTAMDAREMIARVSLRQGALGEVVGQGEQMIRGHAGGEAEGFRHVALLLTQAPDDRADGAISAMQQLAAKWPQLAGAHHAMGLLALRFGRLDLAEQATRKALQLEPTAKDHSLLLVGVLIKQGKLDTADAEMERLAAKDPQAAELRMGYAKLLLESSERERARVQLGKVLQLKPDFIDASFALGVLAIGDRDYATAEKHLVPLLEGERGKDAALQLGRMEEARRNYDKAIEYYARVQTGTQALDALVRRAGVQARTGKLTEAQSVMRQLREQFPQLATRFWLAEGELLVNAGALPEALATYEVALAQIPEDPDLLYGRSLVHERMGKIDLAEKDLRKVIAADKDDARALNALAYMLAVHTRRLDEARTLVSRALELEPDDAAIIDSMGWITFKLGDAGAARGWLQKAFDRFPDPEVAAHLGEVLWVLGEKDQARAVWDKALKEDPDHRVLKETVQRLTQ